MPRDHLVEPVIDGLILHFSVERAELGEVLHHCRDAVQAALDQHYYVGVSHLFGVAAIALIRSGDAKAGAWLALPRGRWLRGCRGVADRVAGRAHCRHRVGRRDRTNRDIAVMSNGTDAHGFFLSLSPV